MKIKLKKRKKLSPKRQYSLSVDGVTQGLLVNWMTCRQKARWFLDGWSRKGTSMGLTFGTITHCCLEMIYQDLVDGTLKGTPDETYVRTQVVKAEKLWRKENPSPNVSTLQNLEMSLLIAEATLPAYFEHYEEDIKRIPWTCIERSFGVPMTLDSGTKVPVRGKMDGEYKTKRIWLFETKTKSQINEFQLLETLSYDIQVMLYLWALWKIHGKFPAGVLYNVIRRSCLNQKRGETLLAFQKRIRADIDSRPEWYFMRYEIAVTKSDLLKFDKELKGMVTDFAQWTLGLAPTYKNTSQCITKYGTCDYVQMCSSNNFNGFEKREKVFRELEDY